MNELCTMLVCILCGVFAQFASAIDSPVADAAMKGKGHKFAGLASKIEKDLLPKWGDMPITAITEHALNDWIFRARTRRITYQSDNHTRFVTDYGLLSLCLSMMF